MEKGEECWVFLHLKHFPISGSRGDFSMRSWRHSQDAGNDDLKVFEISLQLRPCEKMSLQMTAGLNKTRNGH
jgi:hypothetical protein